MRPKPRGKSYEAEANFWRLRQRPRPKIIMKKYQIMINNIRFKIIAGKIDKIPEFYTIFARKKMPNYIIRQWDRGQTEAKCLRPRPNLWGRGQNLGPFGLEDLTSLVLAMSNADLHRNKQILMNTFRPHATSASISIERIAVLVSLILYRELLCFAVDLYQISQEQEATAAVMGCDFKVKCLLM